MRRRSLIFGLLFAARLLAATDPIADVPFDFLHNQVVVETWVNGQGPFRFVLDTGTHATTIDISLAARLGLRLKTSQKQATGAGTRRIKVVETICSELNAGGRSVFQVPATALDLAGVSRAMGRKLDGVLGSGFLNGSITQIDYFRRRIRFYSESPFPAGPRPADSPRRFSEPLRFHQNSVLPVLEDCAINGTPVRLTVDTGSSFGLILFPRAVRELGLVDLAQKGAPLDAAGYRGQVRFSKGWVSLKLRTIDLGAIEAAYVEKGYGDDEDPKVRAGSLGNLILQDFVLTLDYVNRVVIFESSQE